MEIWFWFIKLVGEYLFIENGWLFTWDLKCMGWRKVASVGTRIIGGRKFV